MTPIYTVDFTEAQFQVLAALLEPRDLGPLPVNRERRHYKIGHTQGATAAIVWDSSAIVALRDVLAVSTEVLAQKIQVNRSTLLTWLKGEGRGPGGLSVRKLNELLVGLPKHQREQFATRRMLQVTS